MCIPKIVPYGNNSGRRLTRRENHAGLFPQALKVSLHRCDEREPGHSTRRLGAPRHDRSSSPLQSAWDGRSRETMHYSLQRLNSEFVWQWVTGAAILDSIQFVFYPLTSLDFAMQG